MVVRRVAEGRPRTGEPRFRAAWTAYSVVGLGVKSGPVDDPNFGFHFQRPQTRPIKITGEGSISTDGVRGENCVYLRIGSPRGQADSQYQPGVGCHQGLGQEGRRSGSTWETCTNDGGWGVWGGGRVVGR